MSTSRSESDFGPGVITLSLRTELDFSSSDEICCSNGAVLTDKIVTITNNLSIYSGNPSLLFDHCAECQSCCNVDAGYGTLEITLTQAEAAAHQRLCIEDKCTHLGRQGCKLGDDKPLSCKLYPLSFDHEAMKYYFDKACPLLPEYKRQLKNPNSDAALHIKKMNHLLMQLMHTDTDFLKRNREIDLDFFELTPLATPTYLKDKS